MNWWVLVLIASLNGAENHVERIAGFNTKDSCAYVGRVLLKMSGNNSPKYLAFACELEKR